MIARHGKTSRHSPAFAASPCALASRRRGPLLGGLCLATLLAAPAFAEEPAAAAPAVTTDSAAPDATAPTDPALDAPFFPLSAGEEAPFDPDFTPDFSGFDPATAGTTAAATTSNTPDYQAPKIDAYFDIASGSPDFDSLAFSDTTTGYRLLAGFRLEDVGGETWRVAPEVGFLRLGTAQRSNSRVDPNNPGAPDYIVTITEIDTQEISSLTFGARVGRKWGRHAEPFLRIGAHVYHSLYQEQTTYEYEPKADPIPPRATEYTPPQSISAVKLAPYGTVGFAWSLGQVPSIYVEQGYYFVDNEAVGLTAVGFLLNF